MTDTLDGRAIGRTLWLPPSGSITITLDVSTSDDPDISGRDVELWFQPLSLGAPDSGESLVTVTRDYTDAATGVATYTFDAGALWTAVGSSTVRGLVVPASGEPWFSLLVVLDLDGTAAQTATTLPAIVGGSLELAATLSTVAGSPGPAGADGNTVLYGSGAPDDGADGVDGDFYIDTDGPTLYGPKAGGSWPAGTSLVGPSGSGSGDVVGPASATDSAVVLFDGTTGKLVKDSTVTLGDSASKNVGTTAGTVAAGDDARLSDARTPTTHAASHADGGVDEVSVDASQVTSGQLDMARIASGTPDGTKFVADDGTLRTPAGGGGGGSQVWANGPFYPSEVGEFIGTPMASFTAATVSSSVSNSCGTVIVSAMPVYRAVTVDEVSIRVSTAATDSGAIFQIGVCPPDADTLLPDFASMLGIVTADATSVAKHVSAISGGWDLTRGLWFVCVGMVSTTSKAGVNPQLYQVRQSSMSVPAWSALDNWNLIVIGSRTVDADIDTATVDWALSSAAQRGPMAAFEIGATL